VDRKSFESGKKKVADSKISGYMLTGPYCLLACSFIPACVLSTHDQKP